MLKTRIFSLKFGIFGRKQQMPRTMRSTVTPRRRFIKFFDDLLIDKRIQFRDDPGRFSRERVVAFALNHSDETLLQVEGGDQQFLQSRVTSESGECVEKRLRPRRSIADHS